MSLGQRSDEGSVRIRSNHWLPLRLVVSHWFLEHGLAGHLTITEWYSSGRIGRRRDQADGLCNAQAVGLNPTSGSKSTGQVAYFLGFTFGRPAMGSGLAAALPIRLDPELRPAVDEPVAIENAALSEVMREALPRDLKTQCGPCLYPLQNRSLLPRDGSSLKDRRRAGPA